MTKIAHKYKVGQTVSATDKAGETQKAKIVSLHDVAGKAAYVVENGDGDQIVVDERHLKAAKGTVEPSNDNDGDEGDLEGLEGLLSMLFNGEAEAA